jgi:predicted metal-dependent hydrolase
MKHTIQEVLSFLSPGTTIEYNDAEDYYGEIKNSKIIVLTAAWKSLYKSPEKQLYVLLHEISHLKTSLVGHNDAFYIVLESLIKQFNISWNVARELEQIYPERWNRFE